MPRLEVTPANADDVGVFIASGIGGFSTIESEHLALDQRRAAPHLAVLHSRVDHQSGGGPGVDSVRRARAEPGDVHGVHGLGARDRRGVRNHQARRRGRDDRRRVRGGHHADGRRRVRRAARAVDPQRRAGAGEPSVRQGPRRLRHRRRRRHAHPRGTRGRPPARRDDLRRDRRLRACRAMRFI